MHSVGQEHSSASSPAPGLVSVLIPCYNSESYLPSLFASLRAQTYGRIEVILVDDCSQDRSWELASELAAGLRERLEAVHLLRNASNLRPGRSLMRAFSICRGEYICVLDADDYYHPERTEKCLRFLEQNPDFGAVHSDVVFVRHDGAHQVGFWKQTGREIPSGWVFDALLAGNFVLYGSLMQRRQYWRRCCLYADYLRRDYKMSDYPSLLNLSRLAKIGYIDEPLFFYRLHRTSRSQSPYPGERQAFERSQARIRQDARLGVLQPLAPASAGEQRRQQEQA